MKKILIIALLLYGQSWAQETVLNYSQQRFNLTNKSLTLSLQKEKPAFFQTESAERKSPGKAFFYSLLLPGSGELYSGNKGHAEFFFGLELVLWGSYAFNSYYYNTLRDDYQSYAATHAAVSKSGKDKQYWIDIGKFNTIYAYNEQRLRDRRLEDVYPETAEYNWRWDSKANRYTYDSKRLNAVDVKNREIYFLTAVVINHIVSGINAMRLVRRYNREHAQSRTNYNFVYHNSPDGDVYWGLQLTRHF